MRKTFLISLVATFGVSTGLAILGAIAYPVAMKARESVEPTVEYAGHYWSQERCGKHPEFPLSFTITNKSQKLYGIEFTVAVTNKGEGKARITAHYESYNIRGENDVKLECRPAPKGFDVSKHEIYVTSVTAHFTPGY